MDLTQKQELFVQGLVMGLSKSEAYRKAYNSANMKDETINNKAYVLSNKDHIRARYEALMNEHKEKALWTREEATNSLKYILSEAIESIRETGIKPANTNAAINAIRELNKVELDSVLETKKKQVDIEYTEAKVELIKGKKKDTSLLDALIGVIQE